MEYKIFFFVPQVISFRLTKQASKNVADTTFNKDAGIQSATSPKNKIFCKYISKPFSKILEQVLNRTPFRGCYGTNMLKFLFLNVLSFAKKPFKSGKCLSKILDTYVWFSTVSFIVVYLIPVLRWRLKFGIIFKCISNIL